MNKRLLFLAVGLLAMLAFSTPSQAGSTTVTVNSTLNPIPGGVTSITELDVTFTAASPFTGLTLVTPATGTGATISSSVETVKITIPSAVSGAYIGVFGEAFAHFHFTVPVDIATAQSTVTVTSTTWITNAGSEAGSSSVSFSGGQLSSVPEPASMAFWASA